MKLLFISQYFYPETFKGNDIVFDFAKRGHEVTVLTAKPNYPNGKFFVGYNLFNKRLEYIQGVKVFRTPIIPRGKGNGLILFLNYLSFIFFSFFTVHFRIHEKYDVIFVQQLSPVTMALPGLWIKKKQNIPLILWVLDLWPESVSAASNINNRFIINTINSIVKNIYNKSDKILISSEFFRKSIKEKLDNKNRPIVYFPNWAEDIFTDQELIKHNISLPTLPNGKKIMFAGNLGAAQDFESILNAAELTIIKKPDLYWIIVGEGRKLEFIKSETIKRKLSNVLLLGRFPINQMPHLFKLADIMLVTLKDSPALSLTVPAKIQAYMASSKIILGMLNGEGNELIRTAQCGSSVNAGDFKNLAEHAIFLSSISENKKIILENNALNYYLEHFEKKKLMSKLEDEINKTIEIYNLNRC